MAAKDISGLMGALDLNSTQQQNTDAPASGGNNADEPKPHTRRRRRRARTHKADGRQASPQQNHKPNSSARKDDRAPRANKTAMTPEQPAPPKADSGSPPNAGERRASKEKSSAADGSASKIRPSHIYIVQVMRPSEHVEGVYSSVVDANKRALDYLETKHGIKANEVSEERGLFGQATSVANATKRIWRQTGTLEILTRGGPPWIRVLKKPLYFCQTTAAEEPVYLSLDRSDGIFVIGAYQSPNEAWEGCKKYWSDLSVCASMSGLKEWHGGGSHRAQATIAGKLHRWSLKHCKLL